MVATRKLRPVGLCINGAMRNYAFLPIFLMPHATFCPQRSAVPDSSSPLGIPRLKDTHQISTHTADKPRETIGQALEPSLPGAPGRHTAILHQQRTQFNGKLSILLQKSQQTVCTIKTTNDHNDQSLEHQSIRKILWPSSAWLILFFRYENHIDHLYKRDKKWFFESDLAFLRSFRFGDLLRNGDAALISTLKSAAFLLPHDL